MPRTKNGKRTWRYSDEFKAKAVEMSYQPDLQVQQVADGLGIHPFMLSRWRKEFREGKIKPLPNGKIDMKQERKPPAEPESAELKRLRKEVTRLRKENDLLKKWQRYLAEQKRNGLDLSRPSEKS